jgi:oligopeptide/dipeptide ABC transporter ATP-binding protein
VMYAGHIVESAPVDEIYYDPRHPYTKGLLNSVPKLRGEHAYRLASIAGAPPDLTTEPAGCPFKPRCTFAVQRCETENPSLLPVPDPRDGTEHSAACWADVRHGART